MINEFDTPEIQSFKDTLATKTNADVTAELAALELEEKQLDLEIKRETVSKIRSQRMAKQDEARAKLLATKQFLAQRKANQDNCNHRKGGIGAEAVMRGQGTDAMYAVIKHKLPCNRYFVLCQRCGKEWHPAQPLFGIKATEGYEEAIRFPSDNTPSGSSTFMFERSDNLVAAQE
jgi:hypothetical protein